MPAALDRVWAVLTDFSSMHRWFLGLREVSLVGTPRVGAERRVTFLNGLVHREIVTAWEPCAHLALVAPEPSGLITAGASVDIHLRGIPQGTTQGAPQGVLLSWCIDFQFSLWRPLAFLVGRVARGVVGAALGISLRRLRKLAVSASQPR
jgi:hypothetical protein